MTILKRNYFLALVSALSVFPIHAISGTNPIGWTLDNPLLNPLYLQKTSTVTYTLTNQLPVQLAKPLLITKQGNPQSEFSYQDNCSGLRLTPQQSCTVTVSLTPRGRGEKTFQLIIGGYDNNQVKLPLLTTVAVSEVVDNEVVGAVTHALPSIADAGIPAGFEFSFTNRGTTTANNMVLSFTQSTVPGQINILSNTCINSLAAKGSCTVTGTYTPNSQTPVTQNVSATLTFQGAQGSPSTIDTAITLNQAPLSGELVGSLVIPFYLPPLIQQTASSKPLKFLFTNVSGQAVTFSPSGTPVGSVRCQDVTASTTCPSVVTSSPSNCITSLNPKAACEIQATFFPSNTTVGHTYLITASVPYTGTSGSHTADVSTSTTVLAALPTSRTVNLVNKCTFDVWYSLNGSAVSGVACDAAGNGCPPGTSCNKTTKTCYWQNHGSSYHLPATTGSSSVTIPAYNYGGTQWSGNISASTLCSGSSCGQASCQNNGGTAACAPGIGFSQPATQAEITMNAMSADSYDVETINGFHLPISMTPMYSITPSVPATANNYICGTPGDLNATNNFGACDWTTVDLPKPVGGTLLSSGFYWVTGGGNSCDITQATSCATSGQLCGLSQDPTTKAFSQVCGDFLGYWSADQVCSYSNLPAVVSNFFSCKQSLPTASGFPAHSTLYQLMACKVPTGDIEPLYNSCYLTYKGHSQAQIETCCGCVDWWNSSKTSGASIGSNPATQSCGTQVDPQWTHYIQPMVQWMKKACPSAYVYPFDDKTSGFSCTNNLPTAANSTSYVITFCPGGNTGLPDPSINEGR